MNIRWIVSLALGAVCTLQAAAQVPLVVTDSRFVRGATNL
jgi:hypothetical protein